MIDSCKDSPSVFAHQILELISQRSRLFNHSSGLSLYTPKSYFNGGHRSHYFETEAEWRKFLNYLDWDYSYVLEKVDLQELVVRQGRFFVRLVIKNSSWSISEAYDREVLLEELARLPVSPDELNEDLSRLLADLKRKPDTDGGGQS